MEMRGNLEYFLYHLVVLGIPALVGSPLAAQEALLMGLNGDLHSVDLNSGNTTYIGDTGHHTYFWQGLAQDSHGRIFGSTGNWVGDYEIYEIDPTTGAATFEFQTNLFGIHCISFGPNDQLFAINDPKGPGFGGVHELYSIDLKTGAESFIGSTGSYEIFALAFDGTDLYGYDLVQGLVHIDMSTGLATDVNTNFDGPTGGAITMAFDQMGALYYIDHAIWMMDKHSGIYNPVDWVKTFGFWGEAVIPEGSSPHFSLWLAGTTGHYMLAKMTGATPNSQVMLMWGKGEGGPAPIPNGLPCAGTMMDLNFNLGKVSITETDANGAATVGPGLRRVPAAAKGLIWLQAIDVSNCNKSNRILMKF